MNLRLPWKDDFFFFIMVPVKSLFDPRDITEIVSYLLQALILPNVFNPQPTSCGPSHC